MMRSLSVTGLILARPVGDSDRDSHRHHDLCVAVTALIFCFVFGFAAGAIGPAKAADSAANVDAARLVGADQDPANWMTYGRTYSEQRFSPLTQITADNVNLLMAAQTEEPMAAKSPAALPCTTRFPAVVSTPPFHGPR